MSFLLVVLGARRKEVQRLYFFLQFCDLVFFSLSGLRDASAPRILRRRKVADPEACFATTLRRGGLAGIDWTRGQSPETAPPPTPFFFF